MELGHGIALPEHVIAAAAKHGLSQESAIAVAKADEDRVGFVYHRQPKQ